MKYIIVFILLLVAPASAQQNPSQLQQAVEQRIRSQIGSLVVENTSLIVQAEILTEALAKAQARIRELEAKAPEGVKP